MKKKLLLAALCLLLCVALLPVVGCEKKASLPAPIEFPVEGFTWGMTLEEAQMVLTKKGVEPMISHSSEDSVLISVAPADLGKLGVEKIAGLELRMDGYMAVSLQFFKADSGVYRLVYCNALVYTPTDKENLTGDEAKELLIEALNEVYGELSENPGGYGWTTYGTKLTEKDCEKLSAETLARVQREDFDVHSVYPTVWFMVYEDDATRPMLYFHGSRYVELLYGQ